MQITDLRIRNFKSIKNLHIADIENALILVGQNNTGKTTNSNTRITTNNPLIKSQLKSTDSSGSSEQGRSGWIPSPTGLFNIRGEL